MSRLSLLLLAPLLLANGDAPLDPQMRALIDAAITSGKPAQVDAVAQTIAKAFPDQAESVNAIVSTWKAERAAAAERRLHEAPVLELVAGRAELGGYLTTGNSETRGLTALVALQREGARWRHRTKLQADYQESRGVTSRERYFANYEPNYKIDDRGYVAGNIAFEANRFQGFDQRYVLALGGGYTAIRQPGLKLELEVGPAYRLTVFTDGRDEDRLAVRGSADLDWKIASGLRFKQNASAYVQELNSTINSRSALAAKLVGPLAAQLSYDVQYESQPPPGRETTDTSSRISLLVDF